jgi:hypothetical protein
MNLGNTLDLLEPICKDWGTSLCLVSKETMYVKKLLDCKLPYNVCFIACIGKKLKKIFFF